MFRDQFEASGWVITVDGHAIINTALLQYMSSGVLRMEHLPTSFVYFAIFIATSAKRHNFLTVI